MAYVSACRPCRTRVSIEGPDKQTLFRLLTDRQTSTQLVQEAATALQQGCLLSDTKEFTKVVSALGRRAAWSNAVQVLSEARVQVAEPNTVTFGATANACEKGKQWSSACAVVEAMQTHGIEMNPVVASTLVSGYAVGHCWANALRSLVEMPHCRQRPDIFSYGAAISACEKGQQWLLALALLAELLAAALLASSVVYNAAISACEKGMQWTHALQLLAEMASFHAVRDKVSYSGAIAACGKASQWELALQLMEDLQTSRLVPDAITCSSLMSACEKGGRWELPLALLEDMRRRSLPPDVVSYGSAMAATERRQRWEEALCLLEDALFYWLKPDLAMYNAAIGACSSATAVGTHPGCAPCLHVLRLLRRLPAARLSPDAQTCAGATGACARAQQWQHALQMPERLLQPTGASLTDEAASALLRACKVSGQWRSALQIISVLPHAHVQPGLVTRNVAASALLEAVSGSIITAGGGNVSHCTTSANLSPPAGQEVAAALAALVDAAMDAMECPDEELGPVVQALEMLRGHGKCRMSLAAAALRVTYSPVRTRLRCLAGVGGRGRRFLAVEQRAELRDAVLERQFGLGQALTDQALADVQLLLLGPWGCYARLLTKAELSVKGGVEASATDPISRAILAWFACRLLISRGLGRGTRISRSKGRLSASGDEGVSEPRGLLQPVFKEHDRSLHAERQGLLTLLAQV